MGLLSYQAGVTLSSIAEASTTKMCTDNSTSSCDHSWEVFHIPNINKDDEDEADISNDKANVAGEIEA
jgi:hypothetical protein